VAEQPLTMGFSAAFFLRSAIAARHYFVILEPYPISDP
jgi:hypothetical protein